MQISIFDIVKQPGLSKRFEYKGSVDLVQVDLASDVEIEFKLTNASSRILLEGYIRTSIFLTCSRCLEQYAQALDIRVNEEFLPPGSSELETEKLGWENVSLFTYENDQIDIYEVIRQNILAAIPIKPLCSEDCSGINVFPEHYDAKEDETRAVEEEIDARLLPLKMIGQKLREEADSDRN